MTYQSLEALGRTLRSHLAPHHEQSKDEHGRERREVLEALDPEVFSPRPRSSGRMWLVALPCAALLFAVVWWPATESGPLRFWIEDRRGQVDEWVTARDSGRSLRFSDGSSVEIGAETTARVVAVSEHGARLTLERGELRVHVVPSPRSRWQVAAGPFEVRVTGTRFRVNWNPLSETVSVAVSEGRVEVSGGGHPERELAAGADLSLRIAGHEAALRAVARAESSALPSREKTPLEETPPPAETRGTRPKLPEARADWRELSTSGRYREALRLVEERGFEAQCKELSARDLLTLASTARLAGRGDLAAQAYLAVRQRFPSAPESALAAFSLGRLSGDPAQASRWFETYLAEQPAGELAREASGRLIELARQTGDERTARTRARSYLQRHPSGPHAALARSVLAEQ